MTTITELAKTSGISKADLSAKAGELGFKGGLNGELPQEIADKIKATANNGNGKKSNGNSNGKDNLALSSEYKAINLSLDLEEQLKAASMIGHAQAELVLEAMRQAYTNRMDEGEEEIESDMIQRFTRYQEALTQLQGARPNRTEKKSITERFAELQAQIAKK
ncbi:MAG: hypothetical protein SXA11_06840 [Cyanobacteriota bacterium]|nr:hypothetical protein [Cyanobacteriota bacterium]